MIFGSSFPEDLGIGFGRIGLFAPSHPVSRHGGLFSDAFQRRAYVLSLLRFLWRRECGMGLEEEVFAGISIGHGDFHAAYRVDDTAPNLEQPETDCSWCCFGELCVLQGGLPDTVDETIGEARENEPELVGAVTVSTHAVTEQVKLAVLDAVFHITTRAVNVLVKGFGRMIVPGEGGDKETAALLPSGRVINFGNDAAGAVPCL